MASDAERLFHQAREHRRRGERAAVLNCLRSCVAAGDPEWAARAGVELGGLLARRGELDEARRVLERVVASGRAPWSGLAGVDLGSVVTRQGDRARAAAV